MIEHVKEKGTPIMNNSFLVMDCTECIWYDVLNSQWIIKHTKEEQINKSISYNVIGVAWNCENNCNDPSMDINGDGTLEKCANMVKGHTYDFEIGEDYVKCTNCPPSPNLCDNQILFGPRVEAIGNVDNPTDYETIALASYKNNLYLFYYKEGTKDIYYKTSIDGKNWNSEIRLTDGEHDGHNYIAPSAGVFNDELYVGYSGEVSNWQIFIKKFDGTSWSDAVKLTINDFNGGSYLATYKGKLYVFYNHYVGDTGNIRYRICNSNCDVLTNWVPEQEATDWGGKHLYPSAIENDGKLYLSYSDDLGIKFHYEIYYKTCDDTNNNGLCEGNEWTDKQRVTYSQGNDWSSRLIFYANRLYMFYHNNPYSDNSKILYKTYDGEWKNECGAAGGEKPNFAAFPAVAIHSGKIILCYIKYDTDWRIVCQ